MPSLFTLGRKMASLFLESDSLTQSEAITLFMAFLF
jgi:hypothetical protein